MTAMVAANPDNAQVVGVAGQFYSMPGNMALGDYHKQVYDFAFGAQGWSGGNWEETKGNTVGMLTGESLNDCSGGSPDPVVFDIDEPTAFLVNSGDVWKFVWRFETDGAILTGTIIEGFGTLKLSGGDLIHDVGLSGETIIGDTYWVEEIIDMTPYAGQTYGGMTFQGCGTPAGTNKWYLSRVEYGNDTPAKMFKSEDQAVTWSEIVTRSEWGEDRCGALVITKDSEFLAMRVPAGNDTSTVSP
jgi:hypothetical protein